VFEALSEKLQATLADVRRHGTLSEQDIDAAMREIRLALLEADVNFKVVKSFTAGVKQRCLQAEIVGKLNPAQQVVKIVAEELAGLMGSPPGPPAPGPASSAASASPAAAEDGAARDGRQPERGLRFASSPPTVILMAGLQGSGKTTAAAKLARHLREEHGSSVALAACDVYRPAAVDQLVKVGAQAGAVVYEQGTDRDPVQIAAWALEQARQQGKDVLIVDTSGRLHIDEELMAELVKIRDAVQPENVLLVLDAMTGQDAVAVAERFAEAVQFDGVVMSKLDGDARGGAALSVLAVTGRPILFASTGERLQEFERFHADRVAQRILGMGDVMSLIETAEREFDERQAVALQRKLRRNELGLDDFLDQLRTIRRMGPLTSLLGMIPGLGGAQLRNMDVDERELDRLQAIILSMTPQERRRPETINGSRRLRIAKGSGTNVQQVSRLIKQFGQMRKVMRQVGRGKMPDIGALMRQAR
jgi:signal recognition particle subunit SRP54